MPRLKANKAAATTPSSDDTRSVGRRWTPKLAAAGFTPVVFPFIDYYTNLGLTTVEAMFLVILVRHKWDEAAPFPGYKSIGERMGVSPRRVRQIAIGLEKENFIRRVDRSGSGTPRTKARSHAFDLTPLFEKLEAYVDQVQAERTRRTKRKEVAPSSQEASSSP